MIYNSTLRSLPLLFFCFSSLFFSLNAQEWMRDSAFGTNGRSKFGFGRYNEFVNALALQADGKVVFTGNFSGFSPGIARMTATGAPDTTFGIKGKLAMSWNVNYGGPCKDILLQPDGKILIGGAVDTASVFGGLAKIGLLRFHPDGTPDTTFGYGGQVLHATGLATYDAPRCMALQPDGKILVAGWSWHLSTGSNTQPYVARLLANGDLDTSFGNMGIAALPAPDYQLHDIALQADGKIVVTGDFNQNFTLLARLMPDGSPDISFAAQGMLIVQENAKKRCLTVLPDGKILTGGYRYSPGPVGALLNRYLPDGSPDGAFGTNGQAFIQGANNFYDPHDMVVQNDQRILLTTVIPSTSGLDEHGAVYRFLPDGQPDLTFAQNGVWKEKVGMDYSSFYAIGLTADQRILLGGTSRSRLDTDFSLLRLHENGSRDNSFGNQGLATLDFHNGRDLRTEMLVRPDGKLVVAGALDGGTSITKSTLNLWQYPSLTQLRQDGSLDSTYGVAGNFHLVDQTGILTAALQPDGKTLFLYRPVPVFYEPYKLVRVLPNGVIDNAFGISGIVDSVFKNTSIYPSGLMIRLLSDGRIIVGGTIQSSSMVEIACFNPDGSRDLSFGKAGSIVIDHAIKNYLNCIAVQPDDKIVLAGNFVPSLVQYRQWIMRLHPDGTVDNSFGQNGKFQADYGDSDPETVRHILIQEDGRFLLAMEKNLDDASKYKINMLARLNPDGTLDNNFNGQGYFQLNSTPKSGDFKALRFSPNGKIQALLLEEIDSTGAMSIRLRQFFSNGIPDTNAQISNSRVLETDWKGDFSNNYPYYYYYPTPILLDNRGIAAAYYVLDELGDANVSVARYRFLPACFPLEIRTPKDKFLENVQVSIEPDSDACAAEQITTGCEASEICICDREETLIIPSKTNDPLNGVSTFDLVLINKHVLGLEPFTTPYQLIAADVNNNGSVTTNDLVELRKLILGINTNFPANTSWRFIREPFEFLPSANSVMVQFPELDTIPSYDAPRSLRFTAVKIGDINGNQLSGCNDYQVADDRTALPLRAIWPSRAGKAGSEFSVPARLDDTATLLALQLNLAYDSRAYEFTGLTAADVPGFGPENYTPPGKLPGQLRVLWFSPDGSNRAFQKGETLFYLHFRTRQVIADRSSELELVEEPLQSLAFLPDYSARPWSLILEKDVSGNAATVSLGPNPSAGALSLRRSDPDCSGLLRIFSGTGATILQSEIASGTEILNLPETALLPAGLYWWKFEGTCGHFSGRLVR